MKFVSMAQDKERLTHLCESPLDASQVMEMLWKGPTEAKGPFSHQQYFNETDQNSYENTHIVKIEVELQNEFINSAIREPMWYSD